MMADCRVCTTRITTLRDSWVHLAVGDDIDGHTPEPPLSHRWHQTQTTGLDTWGGHVPAEPWTETTLFNPARDRDGGGGFGWEAA